MAFLESRQTGAIFNDVIEISSGTYPDVKEAVLFCDQFHAILVAGKRVLTKIHVLDLESVESPNEREVVLHLKEDINPLKILTHQDQNVGNANGILTALQQMWLHGFPGVDDLRPFDFQISPPERNSLVTDMEVNDIGPCLGYARSYVSLCLYRDQPPKQDIVDFIAVLFAQGVTILNLFDFPNSSREDLFALLKALQFNRYFTELRAPAGLIFPSDAVEALISALLSKNSLQEVSLPETGLTSIFTKKLFSDIRDEKGSLKVVHLDLSGNPLEDMGVANLGDIFSKLNYGLTDLLLSNLSVKRGIAPLCNALRKNSHFLITLQTLDLSLNKMDQDSSTALGAFLASPNCLEELNLSGTGIIFDKIADAFFRGCGTNMRRLYLADNKIVSVEKLANFAQVSQSLEELDLSNNPLEFATLRTLIRGIIVNHALFDFSLYLRNIGLDYANVEVLLSLISNNITHLDISENYLGALGLNYIGGALETNFSLRSLNIDYCAKQSGKTGRSQVSAGIFANALMLNKTLESLSFKGKDATSIKTDVIPIIDALKTNTTLLSLDIRGHQAGDAAAHAVGLMLQSNNTLASLDLDDNCFTLDGIKHLREGMSRNHTVKHLPIPVNDVVAIKTGMKSQGSRRGGGGVPSQEVLQKVVKDLEARVAENYSKNKEKPDGKTPQKKVDKLGQQFSFKFINSQRQSECDLTVHKIRCTGITPTPEQKNVFTDVAMQNQLLSTLEARQQDIFQKMKLDIEKHAAALTQSSFKYISEAEEAFRRETCRVVDTYHIPRSEKESYTLVINDPRGKADKEHQNSHVLENGVKPILQVQQDHMLGALEKNAKVIYDTSASNLQQILKVMLLEAKEELRKSKETSRGSNLLKSKGSKSPADEEGDDELTDDEDSEDEIEKIMEQGEINQDRLRNQLLFGFPVFFHDGKNRSRVQLYCDLQLTKIMWRHPAKPHQKENTIAVSHIIGISLGANGKFVHPKKGLHERRCFSIALEDKSWDLEAPSSKDRAKWVFTLRLLVGGLVKSYEEVEKEIKEEREVIEDMEHRRSKVTSSLYQDLEPDEWEMVASPLSPRDMKAPAISPGKEIQKPAQPAPPPQHAKPRMSVHEIFDTPLVPSPAAPKSTLIQAPSRESLPPTPRSAFSTRPLPTPAAKEPIKPSTSSQPPQQTLTAKAAPAPQPEKPSPSATQPPAKVSEPLKSAAAQPVVASQPPRKAPEAAKSTEAQVSQEAEAESMEIDLNLPEGSGFSTLRTQARPVMKGRRPPTKEFLKKQREERRLEEERGALESIQEVTTPTTPSTPATPQSTAKKYGAAAKGAQNTQGIDLTAEFMSKVSSKKPFVEPTPEMLAKPFHPRLFIVKGRRNIRIRQVQLTYKSLNQGDAFVLDTRECVYVWYGSEANKIERGAAAKFATDYKNEVRKSAPKVAYIEPFTGEKMQEPFWQGIGGKGKVASEDEGGNDIVVENEIKAQFALWRVNALGGDKFDLQPVNKGQEINKDMVQYGTDHVYILDCQTELYIWEADKAGKATKAFSKTKAKEMLEKRPSWTLFEVFKEEQENILFRMKFADWPEPGKAAALKERQSVQKRAARRQYDVSLMFNQEKGGKKKKKADAGWNDSHEQVTAEKYDQGGGQLSVYIVRDSKTVLLDPAVHGLFFSSETYIIAYSWEYKEKRRGIFYVWQGRSCLGNKKGAGSLLMNEMCREATVAGKYYEDPEHLRVLQFQETEHFKRLFKGKLTFLNGEEDLKALQKPGLFQLKPRTDLDSIAVEMEMSSLALNSRDAFVLNMSTSQYVWIGSGVSAEEKARALVSARALVLDRKSVVIAEGKEPGDFWSQLGGVSDYANADYLRDAKWIPKLFECSFGSGEFSAEQIFDFCQEDLSADYVYILDTYHEVYVWAGPSCDDDLLTNSMEIAIQYMKTNPDGRTHDTNCVYCVQSGQEPVLFTCHFLGWKGLTSKSKRRRIDLQDMMKENEKVYTYQELTAKPPPKGVNPSCLENYLSDEEFFGLFQMKKAQFAKMPDWMQRNKKVELLLF